MDIYEGNIIKGDGYVWGKECWIVKRGSVIVEDNEGCDGNLVSGFYLVKVGARGKIYEDKPCHIDRLENCEIIGNIFENPELLRDNEQTDRGGQ